jgi:2-keto-4-pentenoate hydratase
MPMVLRATDAAEMLMREHSGGVTFKPFAEAFGIVSLGDAYAVQRAYVDLLMQARGTEATAGYKIGLTSKRMQEMCGIDQPIAGAIFRDRVHQSGAKLRTADYGRMGVEFEVAVRLRRDLRSDGQMPSLCAVAAAVDAIAPAIEIVDDRHAEYRNLDVLSLIADNSWNAGVVLGTFVKAPDDLPAAEGVVSMNGNVIDRGFGRDVLDHPFHSVAWLAGHLGANGDRLYAGEIVMTGSVVTTKFPMSGSAFRFELAGLGAVELSVV